jgi:hypothetical protein
MGSVSLTGKDAIQIDGRNINDLADGDCGALTIPNDLAAVKSSKNGNTIYAYNESGRQVELSLRILLGSDDDKFLNSRLQEQKSDFSGFTLLAGSFAKRVGDGQGNVNTVVYQCAGGVFKKQPEAKTNAEGDTEQSVSVWVISFGNGDRAVQ